MDQAARMCFAAGAISAAISVGAGAFGAHALAARLEPRMLEVFETGARYQMFHSLGLLACAWLMTCRPGSLSTAAAWLLGAGIVLFSGSLYALALSGVKQLGMITPLGGLSFMVAWALMAASALRGA